MKEGIAKAIMINNNFNSSLLFSYIGKQQKFTAEGWNFQTSYHR
jgi:hypothetical protein